MSYLAQVNIAKMIDEIDSPIMADFVNNLDRINALAENSPGFVWRLIEEGNNATAISVFDDRFIIVNIKSNKKLTLTTLKSYKSC